MLTTVRASHGLEAGARLRQIKKDNMEDCGRVGLSCLLWMTEIRVEEDIER